MMCGHRRRAVRAGHLGIGGAARMRAHVGGARDRDEGAPLLRRLRPDAVVDPPAQQARLHRVRRQGGPARRLLRHRRHDRRSTKSRPRTGPTRCTSRRRGSGPRCCSPGPAMNFVIGLVLIYAIARDLGAAEPASAARRVRRRNLLCRTGSQQGQARPTARASARRRPRASRPGDIIVKVGDTDVHNFDEMVAAVRKLDGPTPFVVERDGTHSSPPSSTSPRPSAGPPTRPRRRPPSARSASRAAEFGPVIHAVQPGDGGAGHRRVHRRPGRRTGQVAGEDPDQDRRAGALHRRRRTRPRDADQRGRRVDHRRRRRSSAGFSWRSGSSWPS